MNLGRALMVIGVVILVLGGVIYLYAKFGPALPKIPLGQLPGDIRIECGNFTCLFPIVSSIILSIVLTLIINLIVRFLNR